MHWRHSSSRVIRCPEDMEDRRRRMRVIAGWGIFGFLILLTGLWFRQIIQGERFEELAERNHIRLVPLKARRGTIYDRKGVVLADNQPLFRVIIIPQELKNVGQTAERLSQLLAMDKEKIVKKMENRSFSPFRPVAIKNEVDMRTITMVEENRGDLPGVFIQAEPRRNYLFGKLAAHLLGCLGRREGELVGRTGLERSFETYLRGRGGGREILVNSRGEQLGVLGEKLAVPGYNLILTIDKELQKAAEKSLQGKRGSIVAIDPRSGDILALASSPAFDPNIFTKHLSPEKFRELSEYPGRAFFNRAVAGLYPPASTFKIVIALAALEKGIIEPGAILASEDGRQIDMIEALARSSNLFFFKLGRTLGVDGISYFARQLGLGVLSGIDLPYERKGLVPDKGWKESWPRGEIDNLSIGQGALQVTPLQMANLIAAVAQGGNIYRPRLVREIVSPEGKVIKSFPVQLKRKLPLSPANLDVIRRGLGSAVSWGTGRRAGMDTVEVAGKTGTAEVTGRRFQPGEERPYELRPHAWFVGFAPQENPQIALAILVEHGGWGGVIAAPLAREVLEAFFSQKDINHKISPD